MKTEEKTPKFALKLTGFEVRPAKQDEFDIARFVSQVRQCDTDDVDSNWTVDRGQTCALGGSSNTTKDNLEGLPVWVQELLPNSEITALEGPFANIAKQLADKASQSPPVLPIFSDETGMQFIIVSGEKGEFAVPFVPSTPIDSTDTAFTGGYVPLSSLAETEKPNSDEFVAQLAMTEMIQSAARGLLSDSTAPKAHASHSTAVGAWVSQSSNASPTDTDGPYFRQPENQSSNSQDSPPEDGSDPNQFNQLFQNEINGLVTDTASQILNGLIADGDVIGQLTGEGSLFGSLSEMGEALDGFFSSGGTDSLGGMGGNLLSGGVNRLMSFGSQHLFSGVLGLDADSSAGDVAAHTIAKQLTGYLQQEISQQLLHQAAGSLGLSQLGQQTSGSALEKLWNSYFGDPVANGSLPALRLGDVDLKGNGVTSGSENVYIEGEPAAREKDEVKPQGVAVTGGSKSVLTNDKLSPREIGSASKQENLMFITGAQSVLMGGSNSIPFPVPPSTSGAAGGGSIGSKNGGVSTQGDDQESNANHEANDTEVSGLTNREAGAKFSELTLDEKVARVDELNNILDTNINLLNEERHALISERNRLYFETTVALGDFGDDLDMRKSPLDDGDHVSSVSDQNSNGESDEDRVSSDASGVLDESVRESLPGSQTNKNGGRHYNEKEVAIILKRIRDENLIGSFFDHFGGSELDFKTKEPDATFELNGTVMNAGQFGNVIAGYAGYANGHIVGELGVRFGGIIYDFTDTIGYALHQIITWSDKPTTWPSPPLEHLRQRLILIWTVSQK